MPSLVILPSKENLKDCLAVSAVLEKDFSFSATIKSSNLIILSLPDNIKKEKQCETKDLILFPFNLNKKEQEKKIKSLKNSYISPNSLCLVCSEDKMALRTILNSSASAITWGLSQKDSFSLSSFDVSSYEKEEISKNKFSFCLGREIKNIYGESLLPFDLPLKETSLSKSAFLMLLSAIFVFLPKEFLAEKLTSYNFSAIG